MDWCPTCGEFLINDSCPRCDPRHLALPDTETVHPRRGDLHRRDLHHPSPYPPDGAARTRRTGSLVNLGGLGLRVRDINAVVSSHPNITQQPQVASTLMRLTAKILFVLVLMTSTALMSMLVWLLILVLAFGWLLGRLGLLSLLFLFSGRGRNARVEREIPTLILRADSHGKQYSIRLTGHDSGIELGDAITINGWSLAGTTHASRVLNHTTGVRFRRKGLGAVWAWGLINAYLVFLLVTQVVSS